MALRVKDEIVTELFDPLDLVIAVMDAELFGESGAGVAGCERLAQSELT